jgi:2,4-dienoyl-CoA reductase-like NADH-dependent reductase (Old Yellow Enzyme family)
MARLETPIEVGGLTLPNRLYRAPLLECAGTTSHTARHLKTELEPAAASGVGLIIQGATIVRPESGCAAPGMTRVHDPTFVADLAPVPAAIHDHGGRIFCQLEHGGIRSLEVWHADYRNRNPNLEQLAVSRPPAVLRALDRTGFLEFDPHVMSTADVYELAADFGRSAGYAIEAGYDGIHIAGANMGIVQQFLSPYYNKRADEFADGVRFLEVVYEQVRKHAGDVPIVTKVPIETDSYPFVRPRIDFETGIEICRRLDRIGYDGLAPVVGSPFWDFTLVRGQYPERAWKATDLQAGYEAAFGGSTRARLVDLATRAQAWDVGQQAGWNVRACRAVREAVSVPVWCEGGLRTREHLDWVLGDRERTPSTDGPVADLVGLGRPFYAEPRLGARLLDGRTDSERRDNGSPARTAGETRRVLCRNCNNCTIPQVTGASGTCRTPGVVRERARLERAGVYDD